MISPQPVHIFNYLGFKKNNVPMHLKRLFYLSYEDALWDLLDKKNVKKGSIFLLPDFFCTDVEKNIKSRGYTICYYHIKDNLSADVKDFVNKIDKYRPEIIIIFNVVGIISNLIVERDWMELIDDKTIVIEDCVHQVLDPQKIKIYRKNHFLINSLRKVVPLQGSSLYGLKEDLNFNPPPLWQSFYYSLKVHALWLLMNICWNVKASGLAEKLMIAGYDLIGDNPLPSRGFWIFKILEEYLNYDKIFKMKTEQAIIYEEKLKSVTDFPVVYDKSDLGHLRAWPFILDKDVADKVLKNIRSKGLLLRFELDGSPWSEKQKIIYLPMGPYLKKQEQLEICKIVLESFGERLA